MEKLSRREQKAYKEELEYAEQAERSRSDAEYNRAMNDQYDAQPSRRTTPTAFERIKSAGSTIKSTGGGILSSVTSGANKAYDAGARIESARRDAGSGYAIRAINSQSGFSNQSPSPQSRRTTQLPDENPNNNERIYMTICDSQGNCRQKTIKGAPKKPRQRRGPGWGVGGLGSFGNDPGFL